MAKPIVFIQLSDQEIDSMGKQLQVESLANALKEIKKEYFVLLSDSGGGDNNKMQVFYEKDFNDVKYEELKSIIENATKNNINKSTS